MFLQLSCHFLSILFILRYAFSLIHYKLIHLMSMYTFFRKSNQSNNIYPWEDNLSLSRKVLLRLQSLYYKNGPVFVCTYFISPFHE